MSSLSIAHEVAQLILSCSDFDSLHEIFHQATRAMHFDYFALHHHPAVPYRQVRDLRIHNYPIEWEESYDRRRLGLSDPILRASQGRDSGFRWRDLRQLIPFGERDEVMLEEARQFGIHNGFTVPSHVLGERPGSVTFAFGAHRDFADETLLLAEGLGHVAFQKARMIDGHRPYGGKPRVTDRQLEIIVLLGQDKTNGEIADILSIKEDTVMKHVHNIFERLGSVKRTSLPLRAVFEGLLIFTDILR